jgi:uroporphyrin-III C-methyltransferase/precorrin-2 dehydrogenase/sirohydrochlorin ferrochelatase
MRHFPIYRDLRGRRVVVSGGGETALAKLRLLLKTVARIVVYAAEPAPELRRWAAAGRLTLVARPIAEGDATCAALLYGANADADEDARAAAIGRRAGALVNIVDDLDASDFITPALVDRDPVTVAIGTEGAAPVLARRIKAETEARLDPTLGALARVGAERRADVAHLDGAARRRLWSRYYDDVAPRAFAEGGEAAVREALDALIREGAAPPEGFVWLVGAGPGDPELLTLKARKALHEADVVIHDRLVGAGVLELARREARLVEVGKIPGGPSWRQEDINALMVAEAQAGATVARLKSGDPGVFGRLDEELDALDAAGVAHEIIPGVTAAAAAAASAGVSLTRRGRNKALRFLTGHDVDGFAEHDWRALAAPGATAAIYMGVRAARFLQGRLMLHGAAPDTPMTAVENASRAEEKIVSAPLSRLPEALAEAGVTGPAILFLGLSPRRAVAALDAAEAPLAAAGAL